MIYVEIFGLAIWLTPVVVYYLVLPAVSLLRKVRV